MDALNHIATLIRAWHRTRDEPRQPGTLHSGDMDAATAILTYVRANAGSLGIPDMFWDAACPEEPVQDLDDVRDNTGYNEISEIWQAVRAPTIFVAWLGPRDGDDDPLYFEGPTAAAVQALLDAELAARNQTA